MFKLKMASLDLLKVTELFLTVLNGPLMASLSFKNNYDWYEIFSDLTKCKLRTENTHCWGKYH